MTTKLSTVRAMRAKAKECGASVDLRMIGKHANCNIDAPHGKVWAASSTHTLSVYWRTDDLTYRDESIADALERMECGLADCDEVDCDFCGELSNEI